jgi:ATP-dependent helicase HrpB
MRGAALIARRPRMSRKPRHAQLGSITAHGRAMLELGVHPRLAHMMLRGRELGQLELACRLAALLDARDPLRGTGTDADIASRLDALRERGDRAALRPIRDAARRWQRQLGGDRRHAGQEDPSLAGALLACAWPDRIARRRAGATGRFLLSSGRGAYFAEPEPLAAADWLVAAQLDGAREARIFLAAEVSREHLLKYHGALIEQRRLVAWDEREQGAVARLQQRLGELVLSDEPCQDADPLELQAILLDAVRRQGPSCLPWNDAARALQARLAFLHRLMPQDWSDFSDAALRARLEHWLAPYLHGMTRLAHLQRLDLRALLLAQLSRDQQRRLDELAPDALTVPSGSRVRLDYSQETPVLAVRLQEMFGLADTPRIAGGRVPVLLHLLSPARRPVQITQELGAFWRGSYHEVKKELKGRYPKHRWPDDPLGAQPGAGVQRACDAGSAKRAGAAGITRGTGRSKEGR